MFKRSRSVSRSSKKGERIDKEDLKLPPAVSMALEGDRPLPPPPPNLSPNAPLLKDIDAGTEVKNIYVPPSLFDSMEPEIQVEQIYLEPNVAVETYSGSISSNGGDSSREAPDTFNPRTPRVPMGSNRSPAEVSRNLDSDGKTKETTHENKAMLSALMDNQRDITRTLNMLQHKVERISDFRPQFEFRPHHSHEKVGAPMFKDLDEGELPHHWQQDSVLHTKNLKSFKDLKSIIGLSYNKTKMDISDFIRSFASIVSAVSCDVHPLTYNLLLFDSLDDKSKLVVSSFIKEPIDSLSANAFHEIVVACLGSGATSTVRKHHFFAYDPIGDKSIKSDDLTLNTVIHQITVLGNKASVSKTDIFDKIFSILPENAQMRLENIISNKRMLHPGYIPDHVDISRLLIDSTRAINQWFRSKRSGKLDVMSVDVVGETSVMNIDGKKTFIQDYKIDRNKRGSGIRQSDADESPRYCTNCLMANHMFRNCKFTALSCQMCGSDLHSTPACTVYKNMTAVVKHCWHCMSKLGIKRHHPAHACLLLKESDKQEDQKN